MTKAETMTRTMVAIACLVSTSAAWALDIPGATGTTPFTPSGEIFEVDLAVEGEYDSDNWAVIFRYGSVNIPAGTTVRFLNHPSRAPVVWLVDGDVTINGVLDLNGRDSAAEEDFGYGLLEPGPGGFRGGRAGRDAVNVASGGLGPGGSDNRNDYASGAHATAGRYASPTYGNDRILPLIGGSGGEGHPVCAGASGGGAILIASTSTIRVNGSISANGGTYRQQRCGNGAGGAVRLVAETLAGDGIVTAMGGSQGNASYQGGQGRVRYEVRGFDTTVPSPTPFTTRVEPDSPVLVFLPDSAPSVRVVSVDGVASDPDPTASLEIGEQDIEINTDLESVVLLETRNVDVGGQVSLRIGRRHGGSSYLNATHLSGDAALSTWEVRTTLASGAYVLQARAIRSQ